MWLRSDFFFFFFCLENLQSTKRTGGVTWRRLKGKIEARPLRSKMGQEGTTNPKGRSEKAAPDGRASVREGAFKGMLGNPLPCNVSWILNSLVFPEQQVNGTKNTLRVQKEYSLSGHKCTKRKKEQKRKTGKFVVPLLLFFLLLNYNWHIILF